MFICSNVQMSKGIFKYIKYLRQRCRNLYHRLCKTTIRKAEFMYRFLKVYKINCKKNHKFNSFNSIQFSTFSDILSSNFNKKTFQKNDILNSTIQLLIRKHLNNLIKSKQINSIKSNEKFIQSTCKKRFH